MFNRLSYLVAVLPLAALWAVAACVPASPPRPVNWALPDRSTELPSGLKYADAKVGDGATPAVGNKVTVAYTGWLSDNGAKGREFDSSADHGGTFSFTLGAHQVIAGWDEGVAGMKVGGQRTLYIPPNLGYGAQGNGTIPPNAALIFDVMLLQVQ